MWESAEVWRLTLEVWNTGVLGISVGRALVALLIFLAFLALRHVLSNVMERWVKRVTARTATSIDDKIGDALHDPLAFAPIAVGFFFSAQYLGLTGAAADISGSIYQTLIAYTLFWALLRMVEPLGEAMRGVETILTPELMNLLLRVMRIALYFIGAATILEIWGVRVAPVIAGFGLLGVAVALGAQDLFKNLISGVLVLAEKRFRVGDWIKIDGVVEGTVEAIGFRSTKVRKFDKAPVYIPNTYFADGAVVNFGEMPHRRIYWRVGLEYRASGAQLSRIRDAVDRYLREDGRYITDSRAAMFVCLERFSDSSIDLMIYCFSETGEWGEWLKIKEDLLLKLKEIVEAEGVGFAFPSRSIYLEAEPGLEVERPAQISPEARSGGKANGGRGRRR